MTMTEKARSELSINTLRTLTLDSVEKAQHGHAGMPLGQRQWHIHYGKTI